MWQYIFLSSFLIITVLYCLISAFPCFLCMYMQYLSQQPGLLPEYYSPSHHIHNRLNHKKDWFICETCNECSRSEYNNKGMEEVDDLHQNCMSEIHVMAFTLYRDALLYNVFQFTIIQCLHLTTSYYSASIIKDMEYNSNSQTLKFSFNFICNWGVKLNSFYYLI